MRHQATLPAFLLVMLSASAAPAAPACPPALCRCGNAGNFGLSEEAFVARQRDRAEWVALARVTRVDTLAPVLVPRRRDSLTTRPIVARLAVTRIWKGEVQDSQTVQLSTTDYRSSCDMAFTPGDSYVVFASRSDDEQLQTKRCDGTVHMRDASSTLAALGPGEAPRAAAPPQPSTMTTAMVPPPAWTPVRRPTAGDCTMHHHCVSQPDTVRPMFIIDGTVYDGVADSVKVRQRMQAIDPNAIESVEAVKAVHAVDRFGPGARHGAVVIWMKGAGGKCLSSTRWFPDPVASAHGIANPAYGFAGVDSAGIVVEQAAGLCRDVSWLLGKVEPGPPFEGKPRPTYADIVVVRMGNKGYLVHSPLHSSSAGEFRCDKAIVRRDLRSVSWLCS